MDKEMALYFYMDYVDSRLSALAVSLTAFGFYCKVTPFCEDMWCSMRVSDYYSFANRFRDRLLDIKINFCVGAKNFEETKRALVNLSRELSGFQEKMKEFYERCEPYVVAYARTREEWPISVSTSGQEIVGIKHFAEDPTFDEFAHGHWTKAISSLMEYFRIKFPEHIANVMKYAPKDCPILKVERR